MSSLPNLGPEEQDKKGAQCHRCHVGTQEGGIPMATRRSGPGVKPARGLAAPCQVVSAGVALREGLHAWRVTAAPGWFVCGGCGIIGVCTACFADLGYTPPLTRHGMRCARHRTTAPSSVQQPEAGAEAEAGGGV